MASARRARTRPWRVGGRSMFLGPSRQDSFVDPASDVGFELVKNSFARDDRESIESESRRMLREVRPQGGFDGRRRHSLRGPLGDGIPNNLSQGNPTSGMVPHRLFETFVEPPAERPAETPDYRGSDPRVGFLAAAHHRSRGGVRDKVVRGKTRNEESVVGP